jgi:hypothetical protein
MNFKHYLSGTLVICVAILLFGCGDNKQQSHPHFTKIDSLTDTYLTLKDSMLHTWNAMINDDNQKIKAMHDLLHELRVSNPARQDEFKALEERLTQLMHARYTQKSMENQDVIEEYDFASNSLVSELISVAESQTQFGYNTTMQKLVETIRTADQRTENYRDQYDKIAQEYNTFVSTNKSHLKDIDPDAMIEEKPLFQTVSDSEN